MSPRVLTAAALLTAALTGTAAGQYPPDAGPVGGAYGQPFFTGEPNILPVQDATAMPGGMPPPASAPSAPYLATDTLGDVGSYGYGARGPKAWVGVQYLVYYTKDAPLPVAVATVGSATGTALLNAPGTSVALGGSDIDFKNYSGVRVFGGYWFTNNESVGIESSLFILPKKNSNNPTVVATDIQPTLARPFTNAANNLQNSRVLTRPGSLTGSLAVNATQELWGVDITGVWRVRDSGRWSIDALAGYQYLNLDESLLLADSSTARSGTVVFQGRGFGPPSTNLVTDEFTTENSFHGAVLGLRTNLHVEAFTFSFTGKLGVGNMEQKVTALGTTTLVSGPSPVTSPGGFYAVGPALGTFTQDDITVFSEIGANMTVQITSRFAINLGLNYLYLDEVVRPGDQLNSRISPTQQPSNTSFGGAGPSGPGIPFTTTDYWAYGLNLGLAFGY